MPAGRDAVIGGAVAKHALFSRKENEEEIAKLSFKVAVPFIFPQSMNKSYTFLLALGIVSSLVILINVKGYPILVLICISLMVYDVKYLFFFEILLLLCFGYTVAFTKVLTIYQICHT
jgi:hypothetical protein